jgi:thiol-disulfide isomerase/thioredoxin
MKKVIGLLAIGIISMAFVVKKENSSFQEEGGIKFKNISLEKAKKESTDSGKLIFIDAHTSWCGPCKKMAATSFKDAEVAEIYNEKFINLKIDCEKDADGPEISRLYKIKAYPTLLIIDGNGKLIKQIVGFQTADGLKAIANSVD